MLAAIEKRCKSEDKSKVTELVLDACKIPNITEEDGHLLAQFVSLESLCLNRVGLSSLTNIPALPSLKYFEVMDNFLTDDSNLELLAQFTNLEDLSIGGNKIQSIEVFEPLKQLINLRSLDVELNPMCESITASMGPPGVADKKGMIYREVLFNKFPSLKYIDKIDRSGNEIEDDDDESDEDAEGESADEYEADEDAEDELADFYTKEYKPEDDAKEGAEENEYVPDADADDADEDFEEESENEEEPPSVASSAKNRPPPETDAEMQSKKAKTTNLA